MVIFHGRASSCYIMVLNSHCISKIYALFGFRKKAIKGKEKRVENECFLVIWYKKKRKEKKIKTFLSSCLIV